jgi:hypothetical protein
MPYRDPAWMQLDVCGVHRYCPGMAHWAISTVHFAYSPWSGKGWLQPIHDLHFSRRMVPMSKLALICYGFV